MIAPDLYVPSEAGRSGGEARWPGLARLARFGAASALPEGWRSTLARRLGAPHAAAASPAAVAAMAVDGLPIESSHPHWVWLADPVHLSAGLTTVHLAARLRLDAVEQAELSRDFASTFAGCGYGLAPTRCGRFLAAGPPMAGRAETPDPARWLGASLADAIATRPAAEAFRRLGAEIEMWLHGHPLNVRRVRAGRLAVSALWLWGGGPPLAAPPLTGGHSPWVFFGDDPFMEGLAHLCGARRAPALHRLDALAPSDAERVVIELELLAPPEPQSAGLALDAPFAAEALERDWVAPALERLDRRAVERIVLIAGDRQVALARLDGLRLWRRRRDPLAALSGR